MSEFIQNPVEEIEVAEKPKKKSKKKLWIILGSVAGVLVAAAVAVLILLSTPEALVARGFANSAKALQKSEMGALLTGLSKNGSVEVSLGLKELLENATGNGFDSRINLKAYLCEEARSAISAEVEIKGKSFVDASILLSSEEVVILSDSLLGDDAYGISLEDASENFKTSLFGPDGKYSLGIESIDVFVDYLRNSGNMSKEMEPLFKELGEVLLKSLKENAETSKENDTLDFDGKSTKVTVVTFAMDDEAICDVVTDVLDYLRDSDEVENYLDAYGMYLVGGSPVQALAQYIRYQDMYRYWYGYESFEEFYEGMYGDTDIVEEFYNALDLIEDGLDELGSSDELELAFYITKSGTQLVGLQLSGEIDGDYGRYQIVAGPKLNKLSEIRVEYESEYSANVISYRVDTDDKSEYVATITGTEDDRVMMEGAIEWDKKSGDFYACLESNGSEVGLEGMLEMDKSTAKLQIDTVFSDYEDIDLDLTVTLNAKDSMPGVPEDYEDILEMTDSDVESLGMGVGMKVYAEYYSLDDEVREVLDELLYSILW